MAYEGLCTTRFVSWVLDLWRKNDHLAANPSGVVDASKCNNHVLDCKITKVSNIWFLSTVSCLTWRYRLKKNIYGEVKESGSHICNRFIELVYTLLRDRFVECSLYGSPVVNLLLSCRHTAGDSTTQEGHSQTHENTFRTLRREFSNYQT